jgi:hypothetical protein
MGCATTKERSSSIVVGTGREGNSSGSSQILRLHDPQLYNLYKSLFDGAGRRVTVSAIENDVDRLEIVSEIHNHIKASSEEIVNKLQSINEQESLSENKIIRMIDDNIEPEVKQHIAVETVKLVRENRASISRRKMSQIYLGSILRKL